MKQTPDQSQQEAEKMIDLRERERDYAEQH